jgi:hypothetical protein
MSARVSTNRPITDSKGGSPGIAYHDCYVCGKTITCTEVAVKYKGLTVYLHNWPTCKDSWQARLRREEETRKAIERDLLGYAEEEESKRNTQKRKARRARAKFRAQEAQVSL